MNKEIENILEDNILLSLMYDNLTAKEKESITTAKDLYKIIIDKYFKF